MAKHLLDHNGVSAFCESMAMMIQSGISTDEAVLLLQSEKKGKQKQGPLQEGLSIMKEAVEQGESLSSAMEKSGIFPDYCLKMVAAGDESGRLENTLFTLAEYYQDQKTMSEKVKGAVTYPAIMLLLIIAVLIVMVTAVLPAFKGVYDSLTGSLSSSTYSYLRWAFGFSYAALVVMILLSLGLITGLLLWKNGKTDVVKKWLSMIPASRDLLESLGLYRFIGALSMYIASGEMQDEAVHKSIPVTDCATVEAKLHRCEDRMKEGHSISQAAYEEELLEPVYGRMFLTGERSGSLEESLKRLSQLLKEHVIHKVDQLVGVVDPLLSGVMLLTVAVSLLSVMLPLIGMMNSIG